MQRLLDYRYLYLIPLSLSAALSLRSFRLRWPAPYKLFSIFLLSTLLVEALAISWKWWLYKNTFGDYTRSNLWIYNAFLVIRHILYLGFFYYVLDNPTLKKIILYAVIPFFVLGIVNYIYIEKPNTVNNYAFLTSNIIIIVLSLCLFNQLLKNKDMIRFKTDPTAWIALGTFIYHSASLPIFIYFNYLLNGYSSLMDSFLFINDSLNIIMYTLFLTAYLCNLQSQK
jgi:hypothetical protein